MLPLLFLGSQYELLPIISHQPSPWLGARAGGWGGICCLCLVNGGASQYHKWPYWGAHNMWAGSLWHVWDYRRCHTVYMITHTVINIYRLCTVSPMEYNRIEPIIWAFLVSLALPIWRSRLENPATMYLSLIKEWTSCITRERLFWINWTFPSKPSLIGLPYKGQLLSETAFASGFK